MWVEFVDREPGLETHVETEVKSIKHVPASRLVERIAAEHVNDVAPIAVEWTDSKLVAQKVEISLREVEQRADARISLTVIVTQVSFKVAFQLGDAPVEEALPSISEAAIEFDFDCTVLTHGIREPVCFSVGIYKRVVVTVDSGLREAYGLTAIVVEVIGLSESTKQRRRAARWSV